MTKDDGWIEWSGGECPVPTGTRVDVQFRSGDVGTLRGPQAWLWHHFDSVIDILRYRIAKPAEPTKPDTSAEDALWHGYAQAVLGVFVRYAPSGGTVDEVTNSAAAVADAMIAEAKKRGRI